MTAQTNSPTNIKLRYHRACDYRLLSEALGELSVRYPTVEVSTLGTSVLDRPIPIVTIGQSKSGRGVLYVGGIHPTDTMTPAVLLRFIFEYADALENGRRMYNVRMPYLYESRTLHIIPMLDPDGYELRRQGAFEEVVRDRIVRQNGGSELREWRGNARGVDLWRNFTECPELDSDHEEVCPRGTAGLYPESEPETAATCNYLRIMDEIATVLSLHMMSDHLRCHSADRLPPRSRTLARLLSRMTGCTTETQTEGEERGGSLTDWFIGEKGRPAFELGCLIDEQLDPTSPEEYHRVYAAFREALFSAPLLV